MVTYSSIDCCEVHGTAKEEISLDGHTASVDLDVAWNLRYALVDDLLENARRWPYHENPQLTARRCALAVVPATPTDSGQGMTYERAIVSVSYDATVEQADPEGSESDSEGYEPGEGETEEPPVTDKLSEAFEPSAEFITLDYRKFRWGSATGTPLKEGESPGKLNLGAVLVRTLYDVSSIPTSVLSNIGKVNPGSYRSRLLGLSFAAETLLFAPPTMDRTIRSDGSGRWKLTLRMVYKADGWNKYWRSDDQTYSKIFVAGGSEYKSYKNGQFSGLLF